MINDESMAGFIARFLIFIMVSFIMVVGLVVVITVLLMVIF